MGDADGPTFAAPGPYSPDADALETGRLLFAKEAQFMLGCTSVRQLPQPIAPEVAFAGRSNVGKSSLINALTGRKTLARTSNTPGRTREINFFDLDGRLRLVDMPGYGYAKAPKTAVEGWTELIRDYLRGRLELRLVCLLIDARHGVKASDEGLMELMDQAGVAYQIVLTKCDKPKNAELEAIDRKVSEAIAKRPAAAPRPMRTSAEKGWGVADLRARLGALALPA
ncbi:MAG: ribosome biogenesis GTP-binding protein YihA/YsxC [Marivibrio sp.]|uniref:ribosome biogenesis GTP-binding protein YihA/YsxC n=1 Tax=Marivibrio sp. TaxID=2039719 RepID=UPI0032EB3AA0